MQFLGPPQKDKKNKKTFTSALFIFTPMQDWINLI